MARYQDGLKVPTSLFEAAAWHYAVKVAARIMETASRIRVAFASACPDAETFRFIARKLRTAPT